MRFMTAGPGRVHPPILEPGDSVALADKHGQPCGSWHPITPSIWVVSMQVPDGAGPVTRWLARDAHGNVQWWSDLTWHPALFGGDLAKLPLQVAPTAERVAAAKLRHPSGQREAPGPVSLRSVPKPGPR